MYSDKTSLTRGFARDALPHVRLCALLDPMLAGNIQDRTVPTRVSVRAVCFIVCVEFAWKLLSADYVTRKKKVMRQASSEADANMPTW